MNRRRARLLVVLGIGIAACGPEAERRPSSEDGGWGPVASLVDRDRSSELVTIDAERYSEKAIATPVGSEHVWDVDLAAGVSRLEFGLWIEDESAAHDAIVAASVHVEVEGQRSVEVFRRNLRPGRHWRRPMLVSAETRFRRHRVEIRRDRPGRARIRFTSDQRAGDRTNVLEVVWSNPLIQRRRHDPPPSIVLVCIDTLRHDAVFAPDDSVLPPRLRALAADGVRYTHAVSHSPWTLPSIASVMTGLAPSFHRAGILLETYPQGESRPAEESASERDEDTETWNNRGLSRVYSLLGSSIPTLPELISSTHETYFANSKNGWLKATRLQDRFDAAHFFAGDDETAVLLASRWLAGRPSGTTFVYVHLMAVHEWEQLRQGAPRGGESARSLYDRSVALVDQSVGDLVGALRRLGRYDDSLIIVFSDHGEHLHDPGWPGRKGHGDALSDVLLRVPMIVKYPGNRSAGEIEGRVVRLRDLLRGVTALASRSSNPSAESDRFGAGASAVFSEFGAFRAGLHGVQVGGLRLVRGDVPAAGDRLLDLGSDRYLEGADAESEVRGARLRAILDAYLERAARLEGRPQALRLTAEDIADLRAIGYLD